MRYISEDLRDLAQACGAAVVNNPMMFTFRAAHQYVVVAESAEAVDEAKGGI